MWGRSARATPAPPPSLCSRTGTGTGTAKVSVPGPDKKSLILGATRANNSNRSCRPSRHGRSPEPCLAREDATYPSIFFGGGARACTCATHVDLQHAAISCRWRDRHDMEASSCSSLHLSSILPRRWKMASLTCEGYRPLERADAVLEAEQVEARAAASTVGQDGLAGWRPSERPLRRMASQHFRPSTPSIEGLGCKDLCLTAEVGDQKGVIKKENK